MKDKLTNGEKSIDEELLAHRKDLETPVKNKNEKQAVRSSPIKYAITSHVFITGIPIH